MLTAQLTSPIEMLMVFCDMAPANLLQQAVAILVYVHFHVFRSTVSIARVFTGFKAT